MTRRFVVDASVAVKCLLPEADSEQALCLYASPDYELIAPDFLLIEVTNAMWKKVKTQQINAEDALAVLHDFKNSFAIKFIPFLPYLDRAFHIAKDIGHNSIYDCIYSALSEEQNCQLITADVAYFEKLSKSDLSKNTLTLHQITIH